jgi:hypothetical protein
LYTELDAEVARAVRYDGSDDDVDAVKEQGSIGPLPRERGQEEKRKRGEEENAHSRVKITKRGLNSINGGARAESFKHVGVDETGPDVASNRERRCHRLRLHQAANSGCEMRTNFCAAEVGPEGGGRGGHVDRSERREAEVR